jgi:chorismate mutase
MPVYNVVEQDNKTRLIFNIIDENGIVDLGDATSVTLTMTRDVFKVTKNCNITNSSAGKVDVELLSADIPTKGTYQLQLTITFNDGSIFSSNINKLLVGAKL